MLLVLLLLGGAKQQGISQHAGAMMWGAASRRCVGGERRHEWRPSGLSLCTAVVVVIVIVIIILYNDSREGC